ncbi:MAG: hypothetical protein PVI30_12430 [Myxococcales bacterium]|jgi:hypothetical protein
MQWLEASADEVMWRQVFIAGAAVVLLLVTCTPWAHAVASRVSHATRSRLRAVLTVVLTALVIFGGTTYFYSSRHANFLHKWDLFHTLTTVRFFDELQYTRLYECALVVDATESGHFNRIHRLRNLRTLRHERRARLLLNSDCEFRFTPERRAAFVRDLEWWWKVRPSSRRWASLFRDKGYNGTPFYSAVVDAMVGDGPLDMDRLARLARLDVAMVCLALLFVAYAYGPFPAAFAALYFFVNFPARFVHMGGSILRFDYVAYLMVGVSLLQLKRYGWAGALFALSTMSRGFPVMFAGALGIKAALDTIENRGVAPRYLWFFGTFSVTALACFAFSLSFAGLRGWEGFIDNIHTHTSISASFRVGFAHMFMLDGNLTGSDGFVGYFGKASHLSDRKPLYWAGVVVLLLPMGWIARRMRDVAVTTLLGLLMVFTLVVATRYYYAVFVLFFLAGYDLRRDGAYLVASVLAFVVSIVGYLLQLNHGYAPFVYNTAYTSMLLCLFVFTMAALAVHHGLLPWQRRRGAARMPGSSSTRGGRQRNPSGGAQGKPAGAEGE